MSGAPVFDEHSPVRGALVFDDRLHIAANDTLVFVLDLQKIN